MKFPQNPLSRLIQDEDGIINCVEVASLRRPDTPVIVRIIWDEGTKIRDPELEKKTGVARVTGWSSRTDVCRRLVTAWDSPDDIESWCTDCAWGLGGGYLYRWGCGPRDPNDDTAMIGLRRKFGIPIYVIAGADDTLGDAAPELIAEAARDGYWTWEFNASFRKREGNTGIFFDSWRKNDPTIEEDGGRSSNFPGWKKDRWLALAKQFETIDEKCDTVLRMSYDLTKLRMDPRMR